MHPYDQCARAFRGRAKEREEEDNEQALPGTTQVEVQGDQGSEEAGEEGRQIKQGQREEEGNKEVILSF